MKKSKTVATEPLSDKIEKMADHLLGIWRFREEKKKFFWCITFVHDGYYYDLQGTTDMAETLDLAFKKLTKLKAKSKK
jgi:hypothetical protein